MIKITNRQNAFTLAEVLVAIGIVGIIAAITLPVLRQHIPSKEEATHKKVNYQVEQIVNRLYDDDVMYPKTQSYVHGFQNTNKIYIKGKEYEGETKFCELFASQMVISSESHAIVCEKADDEHPNRGKSSFIAKDGIEWFLPETDFSNGYAEIMADINGPNEGKNCLEGEKYTDSLGIEQTCTDKDADRFLFYVKTNGTVTYNQPENIVRNLFDINLKVTADGEVGENTAEIKSHIKSIKIANIGQDKELGSHTLAILNGGDFKQKNTTPNTRYILEVVPKDGYYTSWPNNRKTIKVYNGDVYVNIKLNKRQKHCITLTLSGCNESDATTCVSPSSKLFSDCKYVEDTSNDAKYKKNSSGVFEYVGINEQGDYKYQCSESGISPSSGKPIINETTGEVSSIDTSAQAIHWCGLYAGDYQISAKGNETTRYKVSPYKSTTWGSYEQAVRLGTENLFFETTVSVP